MVAERPRQGLQETLFIEARCRLSPRPDGEAVRVLGRISCRGRAFLVQGSGAAVSPRCSHSLSLCLSGSPSFFPPYLSLLVWIECLRFLPNSSVRAPSSTCWCLEAGSSGVVGFGWGHDSDVPMMALEPKEMKRPRLSLGHMGLQWEGGCLHARKGVLIRTWLCWSPNFKLPVSRTVGHKCLFFKPPSLWNLVTVAWADYDTSFLEQVHSTRYI